MLLLIQSYFFKCARLISILCDLKHYCCMNMLAKTVCGLVVSFVVAGGRSWSFQTPNLEVFKTEQEKIFVLISIILCADSVASYAPVDQILCLKNM